MPNKTKQNTKNSTKQKRSQPLYTTQTTHHTHPHPHHKRSRPAAQATTTHNRAADAHTVLNVNPTVCMLAKNAYAQPHNAPTPTTHIRWRTHAGTRKQANTTQQAMPTVPHKTGLPRKEVIQPHLPVRLPCYDFVPIANPTFDHSPRKNG